MSDLISREKLKDDIAVLLERNDKLIDEWLANCIDDVIDEQPTVDAEKHGQWYDEPNYLGTCRTMFFCSRCGSASNREDPYCWHCGSKMDVSDTNVGKMDKTCN